MALAQNSNKEIFVFAAASLTEVCTLLGNRFEQSHPGTKVIFNFGGSQQLIQQLANGAEADLYLPASQKYIKIAVEQNLVDSQSV
ncbi:MAG TPA: extracellular solute-binding protein, partial [Bacteroidota bacterium]|nr:extracellular solute-binding protein [Bacteroidota bacterium]